MKIIYDYKIFSLQKHGGISRYLYEVAKHLSKCPEIDLKILAPFYINSYLRGADFVEGLYLPKSPKQISALIDYLNVKMSRNRMRKMNPDIVHETYYSANHFAAKKTKTVLSVYDMIHEKFPELYPNDPTLKMKAESVKNADHIICISEHTRKDLIEILHVDPKKTSVTHLASDFSKRIGERGESQFSFPYILFVGPRGGHKNFNKLLEAYSLSEKLSRDFKIVCFGSTSFSAEEQANLKELNLEPACLIHAGRDDLILPSLYGHAAIFVYPSLYEGFGIPPLEAMALNCPVACSNAGSLPEVVGDAGIYFNPQNEHEIKEAIEAVVYSQEKRNQLVSAGTQRAKQFTWDICVEKTKKIYQNIV